MENKFYKNLITIILAISFMVSLVAPIIVLAAGPSSVNLGTAGDFVVLAKSGISTTGSTVITGDIGVSPIAASAITGFGLILDSSNTFSKSSLVTGKIYAADYTTPTPAKMTTAVSNMETAYTDAAGRTNPTATELGAGNIGGMTLAPGLYKWGTNVTIPTNVTLSGGANDVWIFQVAGNLNISSATQIVLNGGAQASNIFWQVAGQTTIGTTAVFNGNILDQTAIVVNTGAILNGRALAQTMVTLDSNSITKPSITVSTPTPTPISTPIITPISTPTTNPISTNSSPAPTSIANTNTTSVSSSALLAPLIGLTKKSNIAILPIGGGLVTYTYSVTNPGTTALNNVKVTDTKCSPVSGRTGDINNNNLLDPSETWLYTCQINLTTNAMDTAIVEGSANGLTAIDSALATVVVTPPKFPNTGTNSENNNSWSNFMIVSFVFLTSFYLVQKNKQSVSSK